MPHRLSPRPSRMARLIRYRLLPPLYFLPVEKFSGVPGSPGFHGFCQGATPRLICSMSSPETFGSMALTVADASHSHLPVFER